MKQLTQEQLIERILETWKPENQSNPESNTEEELDTFDPWPLFTKFITGGQLINNWTLHKGMEHELHIAIIQNPEYEITPSQLCQYFDEGNHCLSNGSVCYEQDYLYIMWSNLGHI